MEYRKSIPINVILSEAKKPRLEDRFRFLGCNFISRALSRTNHILTPVLESVQTFIDCSTNVRKFPPPLLFNCFLSCSDQAHLTFNVDVPIFCLFSLTLNQFSPQISLSAGKLIQNDSNPVVAFNRFFPKAVDEARFFTDGSKIADHQFAGFAVVDTDTG